MLGVGRMCLYVSDFGRFAVGEFQNMLAAAPPVASYNFQGTAAVTKVHFEKTQVAKCVGN